MVSDLFLIQWLNLSGLFFLLSFDVLWLIYYMVILQVKFTAEELRRIMDLKQNIRNMSVIAHVDHGTTYSWNMSLFVIDDCWIVVGCWCLANSNCYNQLVVIPRPNVFRLPAIVFFCKLSEENIIFLFSRYAYLSYIWVNCEWLSCVVTRWAITCEFWPRILYC